MVAYLATQPFQKAVTMRNKYHVTVKFINLQKNYHKGFIKWLKKQQVNI